MSKVVRPHSFRPSTFALALEPRILFDGAAAVAADVQDHAAADNGGHGDHGPDVPFGPAPVGAPAEARHLLVIDARVENRAQLTQKLSSDVQVLIVDEHTDGLAAISAALEGMGKADSIQILSHGGEGQFTLGSSSINAANVDAYAHDLEIWKDHLSDSADIQLYGCNVGEGEAGHALVAEIAHWTGADVAASSDNTGAASLGGNWALEIRDGVIDKAIALSAEAMTGYDHLLADADPTITLSAPGTDVLLGGQFTFDVNFTNDNAQVGYAPFVELYLPMTGRDGAGAEIDDGVSFVSATYLDQAVTAHVVTFDANGNATHPLARGTDGEPLIITAASVGMQPGDQFVVLEVPYASLSQGQPVVSIQVTMSLSELADTDLSGGVSDLTIVARAGFEYGNDALNNPTIDPSIRAVTTQSYVVHSTVVSMSSSVSAPEGETATGPNYSRSFIVTSTPADGQTLTDVVVTQELPNNIQVTGIAPGSGGILTSITLFNGQMLSDPALINAAIASDSVFIRAFTVSYASLTAPASAVVTFYVPDTDSTGSAVVNHTSGDAAGINFAAATASGQWVPLDERDLGEDVTSVDISGTGDVVSLAAKSLALRKDVSVLTDMGQSGLTPGDTLRYTLRLSVSDYFAFGETLFEDGQFVVTDILSDGQTLSSAPLLNYSMNGVTSSVALVFTPTVNPDGTTTITFDIAQSLRNAGLQLGGLIGDLRADTTLTSATLATITYSTVLSQAYSDPAVVVHPEINEGDSVGNNASVAATILQDRFNLTGGSETDSSSASMTVPTRSISIDIVEVNGSAPPGDGELRPGDEVTFRLSYDLATGDYQDFKLTTYLPLPLFDVGSIVWSQGTGVNQWTEGSGDTNAGTINNVTNGTGNSVVVSFDDFVSGGTGGTRVEIEFRMVVGDQPFADGRPLNVLAQSEQTRTLDSSSMISADAVLIRSIAEPVLAMAHGVVSSNHGTVAGTTGSWKAPGTSGAQFTGTITDLAAVTGSATGIDGGDTLRLATAIENSGGGGAFDVKTSVDLPAGLDFAGGSLGAANLLLYRGDGTALTLGTDYSVTGNVITFLDDGGVATLAGGRSGTSADVNGTNIVIITYDVVVDSSIAASSTMQSEASLTQYASSAGGTDFAPTDITDTADQQVAAPIVQVKYAGGTLDNSDSSATHTTGSDLVIGESMLYDIVVTLPEGSTQTLRLDDFIPAGLRLDTSFASGAGYELITTTAGSAALGTNFAGVVTVGSVTPVSGSLGDDGGDVRFTFSASDATSDGTEGNNSFVIRVRLVASDVQSNQANKSLQNSASIRYDDPDGDTANGSTPLERVVAITGGQPTVTVREPTLQVSQTLVTDPGLGFDEGDTVEFVLRISNGSGSSDFDAFDITLSDLLPTQMDGYSIVSVTYAGGATNNGGADFEIAGGTTLQTTAGANIDVVKGGSVEIRISATVNAAAASLVNINETANVRWTSLDGSVSGERTGDDGLLNSGALNDYQRNATLTLPVAQGIRISRVGGMVDTTAPSPTNAPTEQVTIGEIVRYRVVVLVPEGDNPNYQVQVTLDAGLEFVNPTALANAVRLALISDGGLTSDNPDLIIGGTLAVSGNENSPEAGNITPDLSGNAPTGVVNPDIINVQTVGGQQVITFSLGNITNGGSSVGDDGDDADLEGISLEFNVRVLNTAGNTSGDALGVYARDIVNGAPRAQSATLTENIIEPGFNGITKTVVDFQPNPSGSTGHAVVDVAFTKSAGMPAYNVNLSDSFAGGTNYNLISISVNGVVYPANNLPVGVTFSETGGLTVSTAQLDTGDSIIVKYEVDVPNAAAIASSNATLTWSSLPDEFTDWGGSPVGTVGGTTGERTGSEVGPNTYVLREGAGLGVISGTLWNDTGSATGSLTPDGAGLGGQVVTLTWAGADGNLGTAGDNLVFTTTTASNGTYKFGVLPAGNYRIDVPGSATYTQPLGDLRVRIDTDGGTLGQIFVTLGEGSTATAVAGYVEQNDAPTQTMPAPKSGSEDVTLSMSGIVVSDVDAGSGLEKISLGVLHGTLSFSAVTSGVTVTGAGTANVTIEGTVANLNTALSRLQYLGVLNYNGQDTLTVTTNDQGHTGDHDNDGIPNESTEDALTVTSTLQITVAAVNDAPTANGDVVAAIEAGGLANGAVGVDPRGNLLTNDTDVDIATNGDVLRIISASSTVDSDTVTSGGVATITGVYGDLVIGSDGVYQYVVRNSDAAVQALRLSGNTLSETFNYTLSDVAGLNSSATLTVTISGANDNPVGVNDVGSATEAGGVLNGSTGSNATGNVLTDPTTGDTDVDLNGETKAVTGLRATREGVSGVVIAIDPVLGGVAAGLYGTITLHADGSYEYVIDNSNPNVERMAAGDTLTEYFSYRVTDASGASDVAEIAITLHGANDNPVASNDAAVAQAASNTPGSAESNPSGNVILTPSRPGTATQVGGNGIDGDYDRTDRPNTLLKVTGVRTGSEGGIGSLTSVASGSTSALSGTVIVGQYGTLTIGADGSFTYDIDSDNADVIAHTSGDPALIDTFTYELSDTAGLKDLAELNVEARGVNDDPVSQNILVTAVESGGVGNATPGSNPSGNVLVAVTDPDGDPLTVTAIRTGEVGGAGTAGTVGTPLDGTYGTLTILSDGTASYVLDNANTDVEALRGPGDFLFERFTYTASDNNGESSSAEITIIIRGKNDAPVGVDDTATAVEAGGLANGSAGSDPSGNVLTLDTDADGGAGDPVDYGETKTVSSVRTGNEAGSGTAGVTGTELRGAYGWLLLNEDGSYTYRVDNTMAAVEALRGSTDTLLDEFSYEVADKDGATDRATLSITIEGANDTPVAVNDVAVTIEAGGLANGTAGTNPTGNVLTSNDGDVDLYGEALSVVSYGQGGQSGTLGSALTGTYGSLTMASDGTYTYVLNNALPAVQALRTNANTLTETFTYTISDLDGATSTASLTVTVKGSNDNPVGVDNTATAVEAGGALNGTAGTDPTGNLLTNDTDVDAGDTKSVSGIRTGTEGAGGGLTTVTTSITLTGLYGDLTVNANGTYSYVVNNALSAVQQLQAGQSVVDVFTYRVKDATGATDLAALSVTVQGAWDAPVGVNNLAIAAAVNEAGVGRDPTGNVLTNDTDVDQSDVLVVSGVRTGAETAGGGLETVTSGTDSSDGTLIVGTYGELVIGADGTYVYRVDSGNAVIQALGPTEFVVEHFTYQVRDAGTLTDLAELTITVRGANASPDANNDTGEAVEDGGLNNAVAGTNPSGNVITNDGDIEDDVLTVVGVRTGAENETGTSGSLGTPLRGLYGDLTLASDGTWSYALDNSLVDVEALRTSGQHIIDRFSYTVSDVWGATDVGEIRVVLTGSNDTPIANDDSTTAVEAGGTLNGSAGTDPVGNVLDNDTDVDAVSRGETKAVVNFVSETSNSGSAGSGVAGRYGTLTLNANGSYTYVVDNSNAAVEALRLSTETLSETFTYVMRDAGGLTSQAQLTVLLQGANDAPVAHDDASLAKDDVVAPHTTGNVLDNDTDVDGGDARSVTGIRTGAEAGSGTSGSVGTALQGLYGTLTINADGSYAYEIDLGNPAVLAAAGRGQILDDVFTYTVSDTLTADDTAELVIHLEISAPYVAPEEGGYRPGGDAQFNDNGHVELGFEPAVFVDPVVSTSSKFSSDMNWRNDGSDLRDGLPYFIRSLSLGKGLGIVPGQFVGEQVWLSQFNSELDFAWFFGRHGRLSLNADGLLDDPSLFAPSPANMTDASDALAPEYPVIATSFVQQLKAASARLHPFDRYDS